MILTLEHAAATSPSLEHTAALTPPSEHAADILFLKVLVIVVLPPLTFTLPPSEHAATVDLDPAFL
jgi:hypothetical protein